MGRYSSYKNNRKNDIKSENTSIFRNIKEGLGLGIGVSVANQVIGRTFDGVLGNKSIYIDEKKDECLLERLELERCIKDDKNCMSQQNEYKVCLQKQKNETK